MLIAKFTPSEPNTLAIVFFLFFVAIALGITFWAVRRTKTTDHFYAAGHSITGFQNGLALSGDYMSAEPLRNLGKYTFADVVSYRMRQRPVRIAASVGTLSVVIFYLIAQMVGAGTLIDLIFGLPYEASVAIVGVIMLTFLLLGGMLATTWVQIVKAVLLLGGAAIMAGLVLAKFSFNPLNLFHSASQQYGEGVLAPGKLVKNQWDALSLGLALMFGTAGLPHILMRFYTVPNAKAARSSVNWATGFIGFFY